MAEKSMRPDDDCSVDCHVDQKSWMSMVSFDSPQMRKSLFSQIGLFVKLKAHCGEM